MLHPKRSWTCCDLMFHTHKPSRVVVVFLFYLFVRDLNIH